ncbi:MAG: 50S ribosomal protein L15 [Lentisphaeria bacterium]|nr:50S ribosomal protein L15 [Lentisphaeria bacterium]
MKLHELSPVPGAKKRKQRIGRGDGSGWGGTAGRGHKGQKSRTGAAIRLHFEGGQTPTFRRLPKVGFKRPYVKTIFEVVNVAALEKAFEANAEVDIQAMKLAGILGKSTAPVKILANGEITKALKVKANFFSAAAKEKIEKAGGSCEVVAI